MAVASFAPSGYLQFTTALLPFQTTTYSGIVGTNWLAVPTTVALPVGSSPAAVVIENLGPEPAFVLLTTAAATTTATQATVGALSIVVASDAGVQVGQSVVGVGIAPGTLVTGPATSSSNPAVSSTTITISQPTTAVLSTTAVSFVVPVTLGTGIAVQVNQATPPLAYVSGGVVTAMCMNLGSKSILNIVVGV
jgi:hypothetical protein